MNQLQLEQKLQELAKESKKNHELLMAVINVIIHYYCTTTLPFYEEDAIKVFKYFLRTQTLDMRIVKASFSKKA